MSDRWGIAEGSVTLSIENGGKRAKEEIPAYSKKKETGIFVW